MYGLFGPKVQDFAKVAIVAVLILSLPLLDIINAVERGSVIFMFAG